MDPRMDSLRRRYMIAAIRFAEKADPAELPDCALFDLFAVIGEPDFATWRGYVERFEVQAAEVGLAAAEERPAEPPTHREFDAQLRRERAGAGEPAPAAPGMRKTLQKGPAYGA